MCILKKIAKITYSKREYTLNTWCVFGLQPYQYIQCIPLTYLLQMFPSKEFKKLHSLVDPNNPPIDWADMLYVVEAVNAEDEESKDSDEEKENDHEQYGRVSHLALGDSSNRIPTVGAPVVADRIFPPLGYHSWSGCVHYVNVGSSHVGWRGLVDIDRVRPLVRRRLLLFHLLLLRGCVWRARGRTTV